MPTISKRDLRAIRRILTEASDDGMTWGGTAPRFLVAAIDRALSPRRGVAERRKTKASKRRTKNAETARIREAVFERALGRCETVDPDSGARCQFQATEMDHALSRRVPQMVSNCIARCQNHHLLRTRNFPDCRWWLRSDLRHYKAHGYATEALATQNRLAFEKTAAEFVAGRRDAP